MATAVLYQESLNDGANVLPSVPVAHGKERRASVVIKETEQLLDGLHQDADRSNALMAELERLLAESYLASRSQAGKSEDDTDAPQQPISTVHFSTVQPMPDALSDDEDQKADDNSSDSDDEAQPPSALRAKSSSVTLGKSGSEKRRSSVVTFDGSSLFSSAPPAHSFTSATGMYPYPHPPNSPSVGGPQSPLTQRAPSFTRNLRASSLQSNKSFTEGRSMRRRAPTEVGSVAPSATSFTGVVAGVALSGASFSNGALMATGGRRSTITDAPPEAFGVGAGVSVAAQIRRASGVSYTSARPMSVSQLSMSQVQSPCSPSSTEVAPVEEEDEEARSGPVEADGAGSKAAAGGGGRAHGSGRFMRILKGIFQAHHDHRQSSNGTPLASTPSVERGGTPAPAPASVVPLDSSRTHGALAGMTLSHPSQSHSQLHVPLPLSAPQSFQPQLQPQPQLRSSSRHSFTSQGRATATGIAGGSPPLYVNVPPCGTESPQRLLGSRGTGVSSPLITPSGSSFSPHAMGGRAPSINAGGGGGGSGGGSPSYVLSPASSHGLSPGALTELRQGTASRRSLNLQSPLPQL